MELTVLGCWGAYPIQHEGTSSYLLSSEGYHLLLDAGSNTLTVLQDYLDPLMLDSVLISHYHHDHIADLGVLQYYRQLRHSPKPVPVLPIYGHTEDEVHFRELTLAGVSEGIGYNPAETLSVGPFSITFLRTIHPVVCFAMRIVERATGKVLVYTADTGYLEALPSFARAADVFLADTYLFAGQERHHAHLTAGEAGAIGKEANVGKIILTHLPQEGDLAELRAQAVATAAEEQDVIVAKQGLVMRI